MIRSVRLRLHCSVEGKVVSQFGTGSWSQKSLSTVFNVFLIFILLLTVPTGLDLSHLGGWVDRRRCPPRARVMIGLAASALAKAV